MREVLTDEQSLGCTLGALLVLAMVFGAWALERVVR